MLDRRRRLARCEQFGEARIGTGLSCRAQTDPEVLIELDEHSSSFVAPLRNAALLGHRTENVDKTIGVTVWLCPCGRSLRLPASWE